MSQPACSLFDVLTIDGQLSLRLSLIHCKNPPLARSTQRPRCPKYSLKVSPRFKARPIALSAPLPPCANTILPYHLAPSTNAHHADAINRYRITHPDRDLRPLLRRIHQLPLINGSSIDATEQDDDTKEQNKMEVEMTRIELYKWKATVERLLASARNLDRQAEKYRKGAEETGMSLSLPMLALAAVSCGG